MIHATATSRTVTTTPNNPTERAVFRALEIGPDGACLTFHAGPSLLCLRLQSAAEAAVLEEIARQARLRLSEFEQLALPQPLLPSLQGGTR